MVFMASCSLNQRKAFNRTRVPANGSAGECGRHRRHSTGYGYGLENFLSKFGNSPERRQWPGSELIARLVWKIKLDLDGIFQKFLLFIHAMQTCLRFFCWKTVILCWFQWLFHILMPCDSTNDLIEKANNRANKSCYFPPRSFEWLSW